jgi:nucleoside-diphosphate-sugar epimerase
MKIIVIGSTGTIGRQVVKLLLRGHEIVKVALRDADFQVDIKSKASIEKLFREVRPFDAVVSAAGLAKFGTLDELSEEDYMF